MAKVAFQFKRKKIIYLADSSAKPALFLERIKLSHSIHEVNANRLKIFNVNNAIKY